MDQKMNIKNLRGLLDMKTTFLFLENFHHLLTSAIPLANTKRVKKDSLIP